MKKNLGHTLPPVIRVFLSSTFADMENERSYFNEVIVPRLNRICAGRGVSFFSVDLRWGITEDEQINGKVLRHGARPRVGIAEIRESDEVLHRAYREGKAAQIVLQVFVYVRAVYGEPVKSALLLRTRVVSAESEVRYKRRNVLSAVSFL